MAASGGQVWGQEWSQCPDSDQRVGARSMRSSARLWVPGAGSSEEQAQEGGSGLGGRTFQPAVHPRAGRALRPILSGGSRPGLCLLPPVTQSNMGGSQGPWARDIPALSSLAVPTKPAAGGGENRTPLPGKGAYHKALQLPPRGRQAEERPELRLWSPSTCRAAHPVGIISHRDRCGGWGMRWPPLTCHTLRPEA